MLCIIDLDLFEVYILFFSFSQEMALEDLRAEKKKIVSETEEFDWISRLTNVSYSFIHSVDAEHRMMALQIIR